MRWREGFVAELIVFLVFALIVAGGLVYVHYYYLPQVAMKNAVSSSTSTGVAVATTSVAVSSSSTAAAAPRIASSSQTTPTFPCSYEDASNVGVVLHGVWPSYMDPSIVEAEGSGGSSAINANVSEGLYCVKAAIQGVDLLGLSENKSNGNAIITYVVDPQKGQYYTVDARSTAIALLFSSPVLFSGDPAQAKINLSVIASDPAIPELAQLIQSTSHPVNQLGNTSTQWGALYETALARILKKILGAASPSANNAAPPSSATNSYANGSTVGDPVVTSFSAAGGPTFSLSAYNYSTITFQVQCGNFVAEVQHPDGSVTFPTGSASICNAPQYYSKANFNETPSQSPAMNNVPLELYNAQGIVDGSQTTIVSPTNASGTATLIINLCSTAGKCVQRSASFPVYAKG